MNGAVATTYDSREQWLEARLDGVGSSESSAVMGVNPWKSRYTLWCEKRDPKLRVDVRSSAAHWGIRLEATLADEYQSVTGRQLTNLGTYTISRRVERPFMFATHDRIIEAFDERGPGVLSIKTSDKSRRDDWDGSSLAVAPESYLVQLHHELSVSGYLWGSFAVLIGGNDFRWFDVERDDREIQAIEEACFKFWKEVTDGTPPPIDGSESTAETLKALYPEEDNTTVYLPEAWVKLDAERIAAAEDIKKAEQRKKAVDNKIKAAIGKATFAVLPNGVRYSYASKSIAAYSVEAKTRRELHRYDR